MTDVFNNREIAMLCWLGAGAVLVLVPSKRSVTKPVWGVVRALVSPWILIPTGLMALYAATCVALLAYLDLWRLPLLKDTIVWFCASALAMAMRLVTSKDDDMFRKVVAENFRVVILLEFLVNTYTFSLPVELILVPTITILAMIHELARPIEDHEDVSRFALNLQAFIGLCILGGASVRAVSDLTSLGSVATLRSVLLAPVLSLLFLPCLYALVLVSKYHEVFLRLGIGPEKEPSVKRYARRRILGYVRLSMKKLHLLLRDHSGDLVRSRTEDDVDRMLAELSDALRQ